MVGKEEDRMKLTKEDRKALMSVRVKAGIWIAAIMVIVAAGMALWMKTNGCVF